MIRYALGRLTSLIISLIVASIVIFAVIEVIPGDPAAFMLGINARPDTIAALRAEMGLDQSVVAAVFRLGHRDAARRFRAILDL